MGYLVGFLTKLIPSWVPIALLLVLSAVFTSLYSMKTVEVSQLKEQISKTKAEQATKVADQTNEVRKTEADLNDGAADTRKETNEQIRILTTERNALLVRLRNAQKRPRDACMSEAPKDSSDGKTPSGDPGQELLNELGEEDVLEADRADTIRLHLKTCYQDYDRVKTALDNIEWGTK